CPPGWVGYNGVCYYLSPPSGTWDQGQERCSPPRASLAIVKDEKAIPPEGLGADLLFRPPPNVDYWLGLHRRGPPLQWGNGSNFSSWPPLLGDFQCVCLAENPPRSHSCSNQQPCLSPPAQGRL
ncbi:CD69 protein, partial [Leiothrix lutea]|nr:CD69 protein [Leiothrix lutea]